MRFQRVSPDETKKKVTNFNSTLVRFQQGSFFAAFYYRGLKFKLFQASEKSGCDGAFNL